VVDRRDSAGTDEGCWTDRNVELILRNAASASSTSHTSLRSLTSARQANTLNQRTTTLLVRN